MPATATKEKTVQELIDEIRLKLIVHNGEWDDLPPELRQALLNELASRTIRYREKDDPACTVSKFRGELLNGEILLCPGLANEATLVHELVHAIGGQELDSEAIENHLYRGQDTDPDGSDFTKFFSENPCRYMDGKTMLLVSKFVIWNPKDGTLWFQTGSRTLPRKGKKLSEGIVASTSNLQDLKKNPPPECSKEEARKCGARCKDFAEYGFCDRKVFQPPCYQHRAAV